MTMRSLMSSAAVRLASAAPDVVGLAGLASVVAGVWLIAGAGWALIVAGLPIGGFYVAGQIRLLSRE